MAIGRKTGGRQKGTPNRKSVETAKAVEASGVTPLEYLLNIMRADDKPEDMRFEAAKAAAPYVHARLAAVEASVKADVTHTDAVDRPPRETREQWVARRTREMGFDVGSVGSAAGTADRRH